MGRQEQTAHREDSRSSSPPMQHKLPSVVGERTGRALLRQAGDRNRQLPSSPHTKQSQTACPLPTVLLALVAQVASGRSRQPVEDRQQLECLLVRQP